MSTNKVFFIKQLDDNTVQISGRVNGHACRRQWPGETAGSYAFNIRFFNNKKQLVKIINNEKDGTVRSIESLVDRISKIYEAEFAGE